MQTKQIQWFPGHMAKTRRLITECLPDVDVVLELLDARIPHSSRNPEILRLVGDKPRLTLLTKASLADPALSEAWLKYFAASGNAALLIDSKTGLGLDRLLPAIRTLLSDKIERYEAKGMTGRRLSAMIVGIPNVGKSSLINRLAGGKRARVEDRPGVTVSKQWVTTEIGLSLLDMPGVLWPKFSDARVGENLAITGAIKDVILDVEALAMILCERLTELAPDLFCSRYKLTAEECEGLDGYGLLQLVGRRRGFLLSGGRVNERRVAETLLDELRGGVIGRITLEKPMGGS